MTGEIKINSINITSIDNVDGAASTIIRLTVIPDSTDIIPVQNQILEIDFVNTTINGTVDTTVVGDTSERYLRQPHQVVQHHRVTKMAPFDNGYSSTDQQTWSFD